MSQSGIKNITDLKDLDDTDYCTYREINNAIIHKFPIGSLVELGDPEYPSITDGVRLFVVCHIVDCDGTPLYELCADPSNTVQDNPYFRNNGWIGGYSENSLTLIRLPD